MVTLPTDNPEVVSEFFYKHPGLLHKLVIKKISKALKSKSNLVELFYFGSKSEQHAFMMADTYEFALEKAKNHFVEMEEYENAAKCQQLIDKIRIENVMK